MPVSFCFLLLWPGGGTWSGVRVRVPPLTGGAVGVVGSAGERVGWFGQTCDGLAGSFIFLLILETCDGLEMAKWGNVSIRIRGFLSQKIISKSFKNY